MTFLSSLSSRIKGSSIVSKLSSLSYQLTIHICQPVRALLPLSVTLLTLPWIYRKELMTYSLLPVFFFFGSYFFLLNFPKMWQKLHTRPLYLEDIVSTNKKMSNEAAFRIVYDVIMNLLLAALFASFSEYSIMKGISEKPVLETLSIFGGNLSLYLKAQSVIGKVVLRGFQYLRERREEKRIVGVLVREIGEEGVMETSVDTTSLTSRVLSSNSENDFPESRLEK